jgi:hypothetical protein
MDYGLDSQVGGAPTRDEARAATRIQVSVKRDSVKCTGRRRQDVPRDEDK